MGKYKLGSMIYKKIINTSYQNLWVAKEILRNKWLETVMSLYMYI